MQRPRHITENFSGSDDTARITSRPSKHLSPDPVPPAQTKPASSKISVPEIDDFDDDNTLVVGAGGIADIPEIDDVGDDNTPSWHVSGSDFNYPDNIADQGPVFSDSTYDTDEPNYDYEFPGSETPPDIDPLTNIITRDIISDPMSVNRKNDAPETKKSALPKKKIAAIIVAALVVVSIGVAAVFALNTTSSTSGNSDDKTAVVTQEDFTDSVSAHGIAQPNSSVIVMSEVDGTISEVLVKEGDKVAEGQTLFTISNDDLDNDVTKAEQAVNSAQSKVTAAQTVLDNAKKKTAVTIAQDALDDAQDELDEAESAINDAQQEVDDATEAEEEPQDAYDEEEEDEDDTSDTDVTNTDELKDAKEAIDAAKKNLKAVKSSYDLEAESTIAEAEDSLDLAKIELEQKQTELDEAKAEAAKRTVTAPTEGTVIALSATVGTAVTASKTASSASDTLDTSALVQIGDISKIKFITQVTEADRSRISEKLPTTISFTSIEDKTYDATVSSVATIATITNSTGDDDPTYEADLLIDTPDSQIKPGMTGTADINIQNIPNALTLPANAVHTTDTGAYYVMLVTNTESDGSYETVRRTVIVEGMNDTTVAISSGVIAGDIVVCGDTSQTTTSETASTPTTTDTSARGSTS